MATDTVIRFDEVSFEYGHNKQILDSVDFSVRRGSKVTIMGQNGAGKSTIFQLITKHLKPESGSVNLNPSLTIALSRQVIPRTEVNLTVRTFFEKCFKEKIYDIDPRIDSILEVVNLKAPHDRLVKSFSGGQQARLLLASALIQNPDILLLDEPTNNLDGAGILHLRDFLKAYENTILIGHSLGGVFSLRILEKLKHPVKAVFLTGTPIGIKPILNYDRDSSFSGFDFDWSTIKNNSKHFVVFHSDNDPYVGLENGKELAKNLGVELSFVPNAGHFNKKAGYTKFDELWSKLEPLLNK